MPADENRGADSASRGMATATGGTASQSSAHKGILNKGRNSVYKYERLAHSGAHTMISNLGEVRKSVERENMPDKDIKFNTESTAVAYKVKVERSGDDSPLWCDL
jgi:hypothetical protein